MLDTIFEWLLDLVDTGEDSTLLSAKALGFCRKFWFLVLPAIYIAILIVQIVVNGFGIACLISSLLATVVFSVLFILLLAALILVEALAKHVTSLLMYGVPCPQFGIVGIIEEIIDMLFVQE